MKTKYSLLAACVAAGFGCSSSDSTQVVTGKVSTASAVAVRAVSSGTVITAARVRSDGTFTLSLPAGNTYSLEVMTTTGSVRPIANKTGGTTSALAFKVCQPQDPWDMGGVGSGSGNMCPPPPPPPCDPKSDPTCVLPPPPPPPPGCTPPPPPCDPASDPNCKLPPPPCDPATDSTCQPPCDPSTDPTCKPPPPPCDPTTDSTCQVPPPPCADPNDPSTCKDPCMVDPSQCACGSGSDTCWPPPLPPGDCDGGMAPDHPPGDFGCQGSGSS